MITLGFCLYSILKIFNFQFKNISKQHNASQLCLMKEVSNLLTVGTFN